MEKRKHPSQRHRQPHGPLGPYAPIPRGDPTAGIMPRYVAAANTKQLPIRGFEQLLDERDLNSIQL